MRNTYGAIMFVIISAETIITTIIFILFVTLAKKHRNMQLKEDIINILIYISLIIIYDLFDIFYYYYFYWNYGLIVDERDKVNYNIFSIYYLIQAVKCIIIHFAILLLKKNKDMIGSFSKLDGIA